MKAPTWNCLKFTTSLAILFQMLVSINLFGQVSYEYGGIVRGDAREKALSLVFTGHEFAEGGDEILETLSQFDVKASFF